MSLEEHKTLNDKLDKIIDIVESHSRALNGADKEGNKGIIQRLEVLDVSMEMRDQEIQSLIMTQNKLVKLSEKQGEAIQRIESNYDQLTEDLKKWLEEFVGMIQWRAAIQEYLSRFITLSWWKKIFKGGLFIAAFCALVYMIVKEGFEAAWDKIKDLINMLK